MQKSDDGDKNSNKLSIPVSKEWLNQFDQGHLNDSLSLGESFSVFSDSGFRFPKNFDLGM